MFTDFAESPILCSMYEKEPPSILPSSFYQGGGPDNTVPTVTLPVQGPPLRGNLWPGKAGKALVGNPGPHFF